MIAKWYFAILINTLNSDRSEKDPVRFRSEKDTVRFRSGKDPVRFSYIILFF